MFQYVWAGWDIFSRLRTDIHICLCRWLHTAGSCPQSSRQTCCCCLPYNRDLARIQEWSNHWCMILNPNNTKDSVVSRSRTVNLPHHDGDLIFSVVSFLDGPNLDILGEKFDRKLTYENHVRGIVSMSLREMVFGSWWNVYLWTSLCYLVAIAHLFSKSVSIVLRGGGQLLNVTISFQTARCIQCPGFAPNSVYSHCVIAVMLLHCVCCTRLIQTQITVCSSGFHLLLLELDISELRLQLIHRSSKYQGVERQNLQGVSYRPIIECAMTFPTLCLTP